MKAVNDIMPVKRPFCEARFTKFWLEFSNFPSHKFITKQALHDGLLLKAQELFFVSTPETQYKKMFKKKWKFYDYENKKSLDMCETRLFMLHEKEDRPDSLDFDEINFMEYFYANSTDGYMTKDVVYSLILHRAQTLGYVYEWANKTVTVNKAAVLLFQFHSRE